MATKRKNISEIDFTTNHRRFEGMREFVSTIGKTTKVWSWGAHNWTIMNKFVLRFTVQAHRHKGHIYIAVNSMDEFDIYLTTNRGNIVEVIEGIDLSSVIDVIDEKIERIPEYSY
jgi:hypothetical protein